MSISKQAAWEQRQRDKGMSRVGVWTYEGDRKALINYARKKRAATERTLVAGKDTARASQRVEG